MIFLFIIFNDMNMFSFASSFASSLAEIHVCKRDIYLEFLLHSQSIFADPFAISFAENQICKESANVINHRFSSFFYAKPFAKSFTENKTCTHNYWVEV